MAGGGGSGCDGGGHGGVLDVLWSVLFLFGTWAAGQAVGKLGLPPLVRPHRRAPREAHACAAAGARFLRGRGISKTARRLACLSACQFLALALRG